MITVEQARKLKKGDVVRLAPMFDPLPATVCMMTCTHVEDNEVWFEMTMMGVPLALVAMHLVGDAMEWNVYDV